MAGMVMPCSAYPVTTTRTFPVFLTAETPEGLGFEASLGADSIWRLFYQLPPTLPAGTGKLHLRGQANATSGAAKLNVHWNCFAANAVPAAASLTAEGVDTMTFATTAYRLTEVKRVLDANTLTGGQVVMIDLTGETSSWTLAAVLSLLPPAIIFE